MKLRCRILGHDWRNTFNGLPVHAFVPSVENGRPVLVAVCRRCGAKWMHPEHEQVSATWGPDVPRVYLEPHETGDTP